MTIIRKNAQNCLISETKPTIEIQEGPLWTPGKDPTKNQTKNGQKLAKRQKRRKRASTIFFTTSTKTCLIASTLALLITKTHQIVKHSFDYANIHGSNHANGTVCTAANTPTILVYWFKSGYHVGFKTDGNHATKTFTSGTPTGDNTDQYTMVNRAATCYSNDPAFLGGLFVALYIEDHGSITGKCKVSKVITTSKLVTCGTVTGGGGTVNDLETIITFSSGTYDQIDANAIVSFPAGQIFTEKNQIGWIYRMKAPFTSASIDNDFMELLTMGGFTQLPERYFNFYNMDNVRNVLNPLKSWYNKPAFTPMDFVKFQVRDGYRGFQIDNSDLLNYHFAMYDKDGENQALGKSYHAHWILYRLHVFDGTVYKQIHFKLRRTPDVGYNSVNSPFNFRMEFSIYRDAPNDEIDIQFRFSKPDSIGTWTTIPIFSFPYSGATQWPHFAITYSFGVVYFINADEALFKYNIIFHWYVDGGHHTHHYTFTKREYITQLYDRSGAGTYSQVETYWTYSCSVDPDFTEVNTCESTDSSYLKVALWSTEMGFGGYPAPLIANPPTMMDARCLHKGFTDNQCLIYAHLNSETDNNQNTLKQGVLVARDSAICSAANCRYCYRGTKCMYSIGSHNEDLYMDSNELVIKQDPLFEYPSAESTWITFTNTPGKVYKIRCPWECKTCHSTSFECDTCHQGSPIVVAKEPKRCSCSGDPHCLKCDSTGNVCNLCKDNRLAKNIVSPASTSCKVTCPDPWTTDVRTTIPNTLCRECEVELCGICDMLHPTEKCSQCHTTSFRAMYFSNSPYVKAGDPLYQRKRCVDPSTVVGFYPVTGTNSMAPCLTNCKQCTDANTCTACENPSNSAQLLFVDSSTTPNTCVECLIAQNRYLTGSNDCIFCPAGKKLMVGGTTLAHCQVCTTANNKVVNGAGYCEDCLPAQNKFISSSDTCLTCPAGQKLMVGGANTGDCNVCSNTDQKIVNGNGYCEPCLISGNKYITSSNTCITCPAGEELMVGGAGTGDCNVCSNTDQKVVNTDGYCEPCLIAQNKFISASDTCLTCPAGQKLMAGGANTGACTTCLTGDEKVVNTNGYCEDCQKASNKFISNTNTCITCPAGQKLMAGGAGAGDCTTCQTGDQKVVNANGYCENCQVAQNKFISNTNTCITCPAGQKLMVGGAGAGDCNVCSNTDEKVVNGNGYCAPCLISGNNYISSSNTCLNCPAGQKLMVGGSSTGDCNVCSNTDQKVVNSNGYCEPCLIAQNKFISNTNTCLTCPAGEKLMVGGATTGDCNVCSNTDEKVVNTNGYCEPCLISGNKYITSSNTCITCPAGQKLMAGGAGAGDCDQCLAGNQKLPNSAGYCEECLQANDKYITTTNICVTCPAGQRLMVDGTSVANCDTCLAANNKLVDGNGFCYECSPAQNKFISNTNTCLTCPAGQKLMVGGATTGDCVPCLASNQRGTNSNGYCEDCQISQNKFITGSGACVVCPAGEKLMVDGTSAADCSTCLTADNKVVNGNGYCEDCLPAQNKFISSSNTCLTCPAGQKLMVGGATTADCNACSNTDQKVINSNGYCEECLISQNKYISSSNTCLTCPTGQKLMVGGASTADCSTCLASDNKQTNADGYCENSSPTACTKIQNCITCPVDICTKCEQDYFAVDKECLPASELTTNKIKPLSVALTQIYEPSIDADIILQINLQDSIFTNTELASLHQNLSQKRFFVFTLIAIRAPASTTTTNSGSSSNAGGGTTNTGSTPTTGGGTTSQMQVVLEYYPGLMTASNKPILRIKFPESVQKPDKGSEISLRISNFNSSVNRDTGANSNPSSTEQRGFSPSFIPESSATVKFRYNGPAQPLPKNIKTIAQRAEEVNTGADYFTIFAAILAGLTSNDPEAVILKFNQFLGLLKRFKFIGVWYGRSLTTFIEEHSGVETTEEEREALRDSGTTGANSGANTSNSTRRMVLQYVEESPYGPLLRLLQESNGEEDRKSHRYKFDLYKSPLFLIMKNWIQSIIYILSWALKVLSIWLMKSMNLSKKVTKLKVYFVVLHRRAHFICFGLVLTDLLFKNTRIILHRREDESGIIMKAFCSFTYLLLIIDFLEVYRGSLGIKLTREDLAEAAKSDSKGSAKKKKVKNGLEIQGLKGAEKTPGASPKRKQVRFKSTKLKSREFRSGNNVQKISKWQKNNQKNSLQKLGLTTSTQEEDEWNDILKTPQQSHRKSIKVKSRLDRSRRRSNAKLIQSLQQRGSAFGLGGPRKSKVKQRSSIALHAPVNKLRVLSEEKEDLDLQKKAQIANSRLRRFSMKPRGRSISISKLAPNGALRRPGKSSEPKMAKFDENKENHGSKVVEAAGISSRNLKIFQRSPFKRRKSYSKIMGESTSKKQKMRQKGNEKVGKVIDHERTIKMHQENAKITSFAKYYLVKSEIVLNSTVCKLSNFFHILHLSLFSVIIPAIPLLPIGLILLLITLEVVFFLIYLIPYLKYKFISGLHFLTAVLRFIILEAFFCICFAISMANDIKKEPVNRSLQNFGIALILLGLILEYVVLIAFGLNLAYRKVRYYCCSGKKNGKKRSAFFVYRDEDDWVEVDLGGQDQGEGKDGEKRPLKVRGARRPRKKFIEGRIEEDDKWELSKGAENRILMSSGRESLVGAGPRKPRM